MKPKIQSSLLFLIIASVGSSHAHGVKGVFKHSYNSASASSSASAFSSSSSYTSDGSIGINDLTNPSNNNPAAVATASAEAGSNGAIAKAGSGSGTLHSGIDSNTNPGAKILSLGQGAYHPDLAGSGSYSGSGTLHTGLDSAGSNKVLSLGQGAYHPDSSGSYSGSGTYHSASGKEGCCKGPFPGPIGSIYDFKPAPVDGGSPPLVHVLPTTPSATYSGVQVNYGQNNIEGSSGLSYNLIHSLPGPTGSIYDFKPASQAGSGTFSSGSYGSNAGSNYGSQVQPSQPSINSDIYGSFPGKPGSIHDSKPVAGCSGSSCSGSHGYTGSTYDHQTPSVAILTPGSQVQPSQSSINGDIYGSFPGKPGSIHDSKPVGSCSGSSCSGSNGDSESTYGHQTPSVAILTPGSQVQPSQPSINSDFYGSFPGKPGSIHDSKPVAGCSGSSCSGSHGYSGSTYGHQTPSVDILAPLPGTPGSISFTGIKPVSPNKSGIYEICSGPSCDQTSNSFGPIEPDCSGSKCHSGASGNGGSYSVSTGGSYNKHGSGQGIDLSKPSYEAPIDCSGASCNLGPSECSGPSCKSQPSIAIAGSYDQKPICSGPSCGSHPTVPISGYYPGSYDQQSSGINIDFSNSNSGQFGCSGSSCGKQPASGSSGSYGEVSHNQHTQATGIDLSKQKPSGCSGISCNLGPTSGGQECSGPSCGTYPSIPTGGSSAYDQKPICSGISCNLGPQPSSSYDQYPSNVGIQAHPSYDQKPIGGSTSGSSTGSHSGSSSQQGSSTGIDLSPSYDQKPLIECSGASCDLGLVPKPCSGPSCSPQPTAGSPYIECSGDSCDLGPIPGIYGPTGEPDDFHNSLIDVRNGESTRHSQLSGGSHSGISGGSYHTSNIAPSFNVVPIIPVTSGDSVGNAGASSTDNSGAYVKETPVIYPGTGNLPIEPSSSSSYGNYDDSKGTNVINPVPTSVCSGNSCKSQQQGGVDSGYASGNVVIQKSDGTEHLVVDGNGHISNSHKLDGGSDSYTGSFSGGTSGSSGCTDGNCGLHSSGSDSGSIGSYGHGNSGSSSGSYGGAKVASGSFSGTSGSSGCTNGNCGLPSSGSDSGSIGAYGHGNSGSSSGSYGGAKGASGSYSGSFSGGTSGSSGCTNGNCGLPSLGSSSGSIGAFGHGFSGSFGGVKGGSGSYSSSGSFAGASGLKPLSDILGLGGAFSKSGSFSSSRSFSKSEASAASSAFSGSYSSAVAGSY